VEKQGFFDGFYSGADRLPDRSKYLSPKRNGVKADGRSKGLLQRVAAGICNLADKLH